MLGPQQQRNKPLTNFGWASYPEHIRLSTLARSQNRTAQRTDQRSQKTGPGGDETSTRTVRVQIKLSAVSKGPKGLVGRNQLAHNSSNSQIAPQTLRTVQSH